jgi:acetyl esterase
MPLDRQARAVLDAIAALGLAPMEQGTPTEARAAFLERRRLTAGPPPPIHRTEERRIPGPAGEIPIRLYRPDDRRPLPALVYFHGGGWVIGSIDTHDATSRELANQGGCLVVSVDYRLAPEHKFPAAAEDAYAATRWVAEHAAEIGADPGRLAVGGDSAGGNLASVVALMARDRGGPRLAVQLLIYPVTDHAFDTPSYRENAEGYGLTRGQMIWFSNHYLNRPADADSPYASPLRAESLRGLPPALIITAEYDVLRDEAERYAERLQADGVEVRLARHPGQIHGFFGMTGQIEAARDGLRRAADALRSALAG